MLSLPRVVGTDYDGEQITAQNGRYGPYLKKGTDSRSLTSEEQIFSITLEEARAIYAQPKQRGRAAAREPLRTLGDDPTSGKPIVVKDGRFGPYVTDGETNATLQRSDEVEAITHERAAELLAAKRAKGPAPKRATRRTARRRPAGEPPRRPALVNREGDEDAGMGGGRRSGDGGNAVRPLRFVLPFTAPDPQLVDPEMGIRRFTRMGHDHSYSIDMTIVDTPDHRLVRAGMHARPPREPWAR